MYSSFPLAPSLTLKIGKTSEVRMSECPIFIHPDFFNAVSRKSDIIPSLTEQSNGSKIVNAASSQMPTMIPKFIVQIIVSIASAILTALGATSCMGY